MSYDRLSPDAHEAAEEPHLAPDLAVEVLAPNDWREHVGRKRELYFAGGTTAVIVVDPIDRTIAVFDRDASRVFRAGDIAEHGAFPGLRIDVTELFKDVG